MAPHSLRGSPDFDVVLVSASALSLSVLCDAYGLESREVSALNDAIKLET